MMTLPPVAEMDRAVDRRDAAYDGVFFVAVRTTGIVCRPSCPSRATRPENRRFFATVEDAQRAGFRPCKRCRPLDCDGRPPEWVERLLAEIEQRCDRRWRDGDIRRLGIEPARARRWFQRMFGTTFQSYCREHRMGRALSELRDGATVDTVAYQNGFESPSGFRDAFRRTFGGPPGEWRSESPIVVARVASPLGPLSVGAVDEGVCLLEFEPHSTESQRWLSARFRRAVVPGQHPMLDRLRAELSEYFSGKLDRFTVPLVAPGTRFQERVWQALQTIPYGEQRSYADIARQVGCPKAMRAVGQANGRNRVAIVIPCHRVVNSGGRLGGYGGGLWRKQYLLDLERR